MPELPEVETITRGLKKELVGRVIKNVEVLGLYKTFPLREEFIAAIKGLIIEDVYRIAKVIVFKLQKPSTKQGAFTHSNLYLTFHLAMTGRMLYRNKGSKEDSHLRVKLAFEDGKELRFTDLRMFGYAKLITETGLEELKLKYGPTPFSKSLNKDEFLKRLTQKKTQIKRALLEQGIIAGLGNIYANDALWISQIHPETLTTELTKEEADKLLDAMREILEEGIKHRGSTLDDLMYVDIYGNAGEHQNYFRAYGKVGKPCPRCKTKIEMIVISGRSTFFCPNCQQKKNPTNPVKSALQNALNL